MARFLVSKLLTSEGRGASGEAVHRKSGCRKYYLLCLFV